MNQNIYTIEVRKARSLTILPQMRNIFTREVMAANANRDTILLENISDVAIKKIARETSLSVCINGSWKWIPVRISEHVIDQILSGVLDNSIKDTLEDEEVEIPVTEDVSIPEVMEETYVPEEPPVTEEEDDHTDDIVAADYSIEEDVSISLIAAPTEVPTTPITEIPQQFKSVPRNNGGGKNRNNNNGKK